MVVQQMANNESEIDSLRKENLLFKQQIEKLTSMLAQIMTNLDSSKQTTPPQEDCQSIHTKHPIHTQKKTVTQQPAKIQAPTVKSKNAPTENVNCFQKKNTTTTQHHKNNNNKINKMINNNTNDLSNTASLICGYVPNVEQSNNFVKQVSSSYKISVWFPNEKPNVIQFKFEDEQEMHQGISILNSMSGNQWASPLNIPNFKTGIKGYGEAHNINDATSKLAKVISAIKTKKLSSQISFTKTKDTTKYKIIVVDEKEDNIDIIDAQSFASIKLNKGIPVDSSEYNLTCIITFSITTPQDECLKTIKSLFQDAHVTFKDENLTHNENKSKFKEGEKYHHYSYLCESESNTNTLTQASIIIQNGSRKTQKKFKKYGELKKNTTYSPYPAVQSTSTFNFSASNNSSNEISELSNRITRTENDIQSIREDNKEIKSTLNSLSDMMKQLLQKTTTAGGTSGGMDINND